MIYNYQFWRYNIILLVLESCYSTNLVLNVFSRLCHHLVQVPYILLLFLLALFYHACPCRFTRSWFRGNVSRTFRLRGGSVAGAGVGVGVVTWFRRFVRVVVI